VQIQKPLPTLKLDRVRIRQVLLNLLNNAARYTELGTITVEARTEGRQLLVTVADSGPGIPEEYLEKVFESFYQVDGSLSRRHSGAGLGLAISKHFVEMHGGRIWVESQIGVGSRFCFSLPLLSGPEERDYSLGWSPQRTAPAFTSTDTTKVLLVHPDPAIARLLERHLNGYQVIQVTDAAAAEEQLKTLRPRAIIADEPLAHREEGSHAAASQTPPNPTGGSPLDSNPWPGVVGLSSTVPLIMCPLPSGPRSALASGVQGYLVKPVTKERLLSTLAQCAPQAQHILVVDDDPRVVRLLDSVLLSIPGRYRISRAFGGQEALTLMRAEQPDLVLLDLYMPELDGFTILDHMAADPALAQIPVVAVSAKGLSEDGVLQSYRPITVIRRDGFALAQLIRYLQALLDASGPPFHDGAPSVRASARALPG
jgi:CheY-like chemotaxis protein